MANNRMFLVHRPTGRSVFLGKRMSYGWFDPPSADALQAFYQECEIDTPLAQDDFVIAMEDASDAPKCIAIDAYDADGKPKSFR